LVRDGGLAIRAMRNVLGRNIAPWEKLLKFKALDREFQLQLVVECRA